MVVAFYFRLILVQFFRRWMAISARPEQYEKDTVQPSDFGFDYESWDDLVSQFELVNADTGETVSWDVLK